MTTLDASTSLADLVVADPRRARLLEALRLDYCCNGQRSLEEACTQRGLDAATMLAVLAALDDDAFGTRDDEHDVAGATVEQLCEHIVVAHHGPLRSDLQRIEHLLATVVRVHGGEHPELEDLRRVFGGLRDELVDHMAVEERVVFPACGELERGTRTELRDEVLAALEDEHADVGNGLVALRELTGGYRTDRAYCGTHRALLEALGAVAADLHRHIHEENNVLFPRVRELAGVA
jgi:regulator of cell morphogenesis and NO signaling